VAAAGHGGAPAPSGEAPGDGSALPALPRPGGRP